AEHAASRLHDPLQGGPSGWQVVTVNASQQALHATAAGDRFELGARLGEMVAGGRQLLFESLSLNDELGDRTNINHRELRTRRWCCQQARPQHKWPYPMRDIPFVHRRSPVSAGCCPCCAGSAPVNIGNHAAGSGPCAAMTCSIRLTSDNRPEITLSSLSKPARSS